MIPAVDKISYTVDVGGPAEEGKQLTCVTRLAQGDRLFQSRIIPLDLKPVAVDVAG